MDVRAIRLRIAVRRHGLPDMKLVWVLNRESRVTIAKLLGYINDVVPLESGEWGLEDYTVELVNARGEGFECLHYQLAESIFRDEDEVLIRPLLSDDIRRCRAGGRHQINAEGKHLIDGVAFGRPWLRVPRDRPDIVIPPRKRARITYQSEDDEDDGNDEPQMLTEGLRNEPVSSDAPDSAAGKDLVLHNHFDKAAGDGYDDNDSDDEDYHPENSSDDGSDDSDDSDVGAGNGSDEDMDRGQNNVNKNPDLLLELQSEVQDLREANKLINGPDERRDILEAFKASASPHAPQPTLLSGVAATTLDLATVDQIIALGAAFPKASAGACENVLLAHNKSLSHAYHALKMAHQPALNFEQVKARVKDLAVVIGPPPSFPPPHAPSHSASRDGPGDGPRNETDSSSASDESDEYVTKNRPSADETSDSSSEDDSDATSSSGSDSESEPRLKKQGGFVASVAAKSASAEDSSSTSSDDTSSDEDSSDDSSSDSDDDVSAAATSEKEKPPAKSQSSKVAATTAPETAPVSQATESPAVGSMTGLTKSQKRNLRRRKLLKQGKISKEEPAANNHHEDAEIMARKQKLLKQLEYNDSSTAAAAAAAIASPMVVADATEAVLGIQGGANSAATAVDTSSPRMRLDVGAGRRIVFGVLGLRNPKTKSDEDKLRQGLMKGVRPHVNPRTIQSQDESGTSPKSDCQVLYAAPSKNGAEAAEPVVRQEDEDPDAWRDKISYRAVECVEEGVELSEPPFPFVQRWDPQQQQQRQRSMLGKRKRGRGKQGRTEEYYQHQPRNPKRLRPNDVEADAEFSTGHDNELDKILPDLPNDMSTLPALAPDQAAPGMIIAWKHWRLSASTNWSPQIDEVVGMLTRVDDNGASIEVRLAKRCQQPSPTEVYDPITGKRIYERFEMPGLDEEVGEDDNYAEIRSGRDDGHLTLEFSELVEPRIVRLPQEIGQQPQTTVAAGKRPDEPPQDIELDYGDDALKPARNTVETPTQEGVASPLPPALPGQEDRRESEREEAEAEAVLGSQTMPEPDLAMSFLDQTGGVASCSSNNEQDAVPPVDDQSARKNASILLSTQLGELPVVVAIDNVTPVTPPDVANSQAVGQSPVAVPDGSWAADPTLFGDDFASEDYAVPDSVSLFDLLRAAPEKPSPASSSTNGKAGEEDVATQDVIKPGVDDSRSAHSTARSGSVELGHVVDYGRMSRSTVPVPEARSREHTSAPVEPSSPPPPDEIFSTARTSKTDSPIKPTTWRSTGAKARKGLSKADRDYEAMMQKYDDERDGGGAEKTLSANLITPHAPFLNSTPSDTRSESGGEKSGKTKKKKKKTKSTSLLNLRSSPRLNLTSTSTSTSVPTSTLTRTLAPTPIPTPTSHRASSTRDGSMVKLKPEPGTNSGLYDISTPPLQTGPRQKRNRRHPAEQRKLIIPEGANVINLEMSSPSPTSAEIMEDYAEDSLDETYDENKGLPSSSAGRKSGSGKEARRRSRRRSMR